MLEGKIVDLGTARITLTTDIYLKIAIPFNVRIMHFPIFVVLVKYQAFFLFYVTFGQSSLLHSKYMPRTRKFLHLEKTP